MITLQDLFHHLETLFPSVGSLDSCPNGLQVEGKREIRKIAVAVSASCEAIEEAERLQVDALIVHHGIFWNRDPLEIVGVKKRKLEALLRGGISLFAYHLPLDLHQTFGNNWKAAKDLLWQNLEPFGRVGSLFIGVKGSFAPEPVELFTKKLEAYYGHAAAVALGGKKQVQSAALISGGAYRSLDSAADEGVDCFITGNFDEPAWHTAHERDINFFALGHHATERVGVKALKEHLERHFSLPCEWIDLPNPF